jgi:hypothetical protein
MPSGATGALCCCDEEDEDEEGEDGVDGEEEACPPSSVAATAFQLCGIGASGRTKAADSTAGASIGLSDCV